MTNKVLTLTLNPALDKTVEIDSLEAGGLNRIREGRIDAGRARESMWQRCSRTL